MTVETADLADGMIREAQAENRRRSRLAAGWLRVRWSMLGAIVGSVATWGWIIVLGVLR